MRIEKTLPELIMEAKCDLSNMKTASVMYDVLQTVSKCIIDPKTKKPGSYFNFERIENPDLLSVCQGMTDDYAFKSMTINHAHWMTEEKKIFKISEEFFDIFSKVSLGNIQANALPDDLCGYCQLPKKIKDQSSDSYTGFYFFSGPGKKFTGESVWTHLLNGVDEHLTNNDKVLNFAWLDDSGHINYCTMPFSGDELLKDVFANTKFTVRRPINEAYMQVEQKIEDDGFHTHIRIMCNLLIYLNSGNPDIRSFRNEIKYQSPTSKTPVRKDKSLSQMEFTLVGFGFKKNPLYNKEFFVQPPYWAHRLHGPGRTLKKYMLVKGSLKRRNAELLGQESQEQDMEIYL